MDKKLFVLSLTIIALAFPAFADDQSVPEPSEEPAAAQPATEATPSCESSTPAAQEAALDPLASQPFQGLQPAAGESCGGVICDKFTYCCNPSCARCVPFGMSCTQESCN